jgi:xanthine dehydrogenase molybdopterin-binding subunit B
VTVVTRRSFLQTTALSTSSRISRTLRWSLSTRSLGSALVAPSCQAPTIDQQVVAHVGGFAPDKVRIHTLLAGGSFGRRATPDGDIASEAAAVAKAIGDGKPVISASTTGSAWRRRPRRQRDAVRDLSPESEFRSRWNSGSSRMAPGAAIHGMAAQVAGRHLHAVERYLAQRR